MNCRLTLLIGGLVAGVHLGVAAPDPSKVAVLEDTFGTYNAAPRGQDGRVDIDLLLEELGKIRANTYNWLIWHADSDWEDLKLFLPKARERGLRIWVTLVPPSESPPRTKRYSEPFRLDYERWGSEIATLSLGHTNLVAWSLDDFSHNARELAPDRLRQILGGVRRINPGLAFIPCCYYRHVTPAYAEKYRGLFDGVLFPYRNESGEMNLKDSAAVGAEVEKMRELLKVPVYVDVYATRHSRLGDSTAGYVREVMEAARGSADGVLIYCHQFEDKNPEKHRVIRRLFGEWSSSAGSGRQGKGR